jgi:hypothetical protein
MLAISWQLLLQAFVDVTDNDWASYMATYAGFAIGDCMDYEKI